jgi:hypothetical protein
MKRLALLALVTSCFSPPEAPDGPRRGWRRVANGDVPGAMHGAKLTWDATRNAVVMYTGRNAVTSTLNGHVWMWKNNIWTRICTEGDGPPPLYLPAFTWEPEYEQLVLAGGAQLTPGAPLYDNVRNEIYTCDEGNVWTKQTNTLQIARAGASLVYDEQIHRLLVIGGRDSRGQVKNMEVSLADAQDFQIDAAPMPFASAGAGQSATYDATSRRVLALKTELTPDDAPPLHDAIWQHDGEKWTRFCDDCSGSGIARSDASIVHFNGTNENYVIAGYGGDGMSLSGTWIIDQNHLVRVYGDPAERNAVGIAWNGAANTLITFGGAGGDCVADECDETFELYTEVP